MNRDHIISGISDAFKSAHGFRPAGIWDFDSMSDAELLSLHDRTHEEARLAWAEEQARQAESAKRFEDMVLNIIKMGAGNRETALRWLLDAEKDEWHPHDLPGMYCFENNIPYVYEEEFKAVLNVQAVSAN